jgi:hypothetical protein
MNSCWRIKKPESALTSLVCAMYPGESSTAQTHVAMRAATTSRSRVNATTRHVRSRFGILRLALSLTWPTNNEKSGGDHLKALPSQEV